MMNIDALERNETQDSLSRDGDKVNVQRCSSDQLRNGECDEEDRPLPHLLIDQGDLRHAAK